MGMLGVETFTPVLNVPEVAILGIGGPSLRPVEVDGEIQYIKAIPLSLTIDHQALDGAPGARFLQALVAALESFEITN
jgi:pyruvate dehydrogenase E2 component (dihydrolipoamide acetyltransferase)